MSHAVYLKTTLYKEGIHDMRFNFAYKEPVVLVLLDQTAVIIMINAHTVSQYSFYLFR